MTEEVCNWHCMNWGTNSAEHNAEQASLLYYGLDSDTGPE